jgi:basic amino acid/polyamine antiporter, APA family
MKENFIEPETGQDNGFKKVLGLFDSTMIVVGSMIGSGIFIVSADIARNVGSSGFLILTWVITGILTICAALSYGELASMMPRAGGQYVYLRASYSPLFGFLYGWALFLVIQSGTIAAVGVAFSRFLGVLVPSISPTAWIIKPVDLSENYAVSLSTQQLVGILSILLLTYLNTRGVRLGKTIQNIFTSAKTIGVLALIIVGIFIGRNAGIISSNFANLWSGENLNLIKPDLGFFPTITAQEGFFGILIALCVAQVGSLFSADAWNNITFTAGEVKNPKRNVPLSLAWGTCIVIALYILANISYLSVLSLQDIKAAPDDRVATLALKAILGDAGAAVMAILIVISTFGCNNGLILAGARVYYAMAQDSLFFKSVGKLNKFSVPAVGLILQGIWSSFLVLPRTRLKDPSGAYLVDQSSGLGQYGNLYSNLLDYVVFAVLIFYVLTIIGIFILRKKAPDIERPYRAFGYPIIPALYIIAATIIMLALIFYKTQTTWPGLVIVLTGLPVYWIWAKLGKAKV